MGRKRSGSIPLWMTITFDGSTRKWARMSSRIVAETAITRSAASTAVFSIQVERRYPVESWSAFQGRSGSMLWSVTTSGIR